MQVGLAQERNFGSQKVFTKLFCKSRFPHKFVNLFFISATIEDKLTNLCGDWLLQNDFVNILCEIRLVVGADWAWARAAGAFNLRTSVFISRICTKITIQLEHVSGKFRCPQFKRKKHVL